MDNLCSSFCRLSFQPVVVREVKATTCLQSRIVCILRGLSLHRNVHMASKFRPKVHPLKHWDHDQGLRMMLWLCLCLSFCLIFVVEWDQPARCEGAFVMKTIMPFTFGRQPIGLLESRQRSSLKIISKVVLINQQFLQRLKTQNS